MPTTHACRRLRICHAVLRPKQNTAACFVECIYDTRIRASKKSYHDASGEPFRAKLRLRRRLACRIHIRRWRLGCRQHEFTPDFRLWPCSRSRLTDMRWSVSDTGPYSTAMARARPLLMRTTHERTRTSTLINIHVSSVLSRTAQRRRSFARLLKQQCYPGR